MNTIPYFVEHATRIAREHGWGWSKEDRVTVNVHHLLSDIALIHSELSEALESVRDGVLEMRLVDGKPEGMVVELADAIIRIFHLSGELGLPLEEAIIAKMKYNESRPFKHGGRKV